MAWLSPVAVAFNVKLPSVPKVILHPANETTPSDDASGFVVHNNVPVPELMARVTVALDAVVTSPPASSRVTTGWDPKTTALVEAAGTIVKMSLVAGPTVTVKAEVTAAVNEPSVAVRVYPVPAVEILQFETVNTPLDSTDEHPDSVPGPPLEGVPAVIASDIVELSAVMIFPPASSTLATG